MKNHPEFGRKSKLYATPYEDLLGKEWKDRLPNPNPEYKVIRWFS